MINALLGVVMMVSPVAIMVIAELNDRARRRRLRLREGLDRFSSITWYM